MRLALTRAGLWFISTILILLLITGGNMEKGVPLTDLLPYYIGLAFLFAGLIFFITLYDVAQEDRRLEMMERRKALEE